MKLGAEPKKVAIFVALLALAGIAYWMSSSSDAPAPVVARPVVDPATAAVLSPAPSTRKEGRRSVLGSDSIGDSIFTLPTHVDPTKVDPTLRLELLSKVQAVPEEGGTRFIFQIGLAPEVIEAANTKAIPNPGKINPNAPQPPPATAAASTPQPLQPAGPPPPAPINLKYYGYSTKRSDGERKAFFLDGDEIIVAAEGEIINKHYKVVRIKDSSVQMEDTASKSTQTLPLQQDAAPA